MQGRILALLSALALSPSFVGGYAADFYEVDDSPFHTNIARETGDIVTVIVEEEAETVDEAKRELLRDNGSKWTLKDIFFPHVNVADGLTKTKGAGDSPVFEIEATNEFEAEAKSEAIHSVETTIQVRLIEEVTEGQFVIRGHRMVNINGKNRNVFISGVIRQRDITPYNTVSSDQIVDASIEIEGETSKDDVEPGFIMKTLNYIF